MLPPLIHRSQQLSQLTQKNTLWDVVVIGGGATGLGIALDAATRGYRTALVEAYDFAKGTSSRSTKLVHGGVRYLAQGHVLLVREASVERGLLLRNAPHLVHRQPFVIPVYKKWNLLQYGIGLKLYDWMAGRLSMGSSRFLSAPETTALLPGVKSSGLVGGVLYYDGQFDDARLAVNIMQTLIEKEGCAVNYVRADGLLKNGAGKVCGISVTDTETGDCFEIKAKAVVNATGVFADEILQLDNPEAPKQLSVSQGVHLVLDPHFLPGGHALMIPKTPDGRVLFAVPWRGKLVVGTTDTPVAAPVWEPKALEQEVQFILDTAGAYLTHRPQRKDVRSIFAGLRPLAAPASEEKATKELSRSHQVLVAPSGLFTMVGGKWTTYRKMAADMLDSIERTLQWPHRPPVTGHLKIRGSEGAASLQPALYGYGSDAIFLEKEIAAAPDGWISRENNLHQAHVQWAVQHEMARTVEDVLARRTRILLLDSAAAVSLAPAVAQRLAALLSKDDAWVNEQVQAFTLLAHHYRLEAKIAKSNIQD